MSDVRNYWIDYWNDNYVDGVTCPRCLEPLHDNVCTGCNFKVEDGELYGEPDEEWLSDRIWDSKLPKEAYDD